MPSFAKRGGLGILEYLLILTIIILGIVILVKLFGPAVNQFIENLISTTQ
jgi:Flp pilus assembly pilin Flp